MEAGSVFVNDWAKVYVGTEEGGLKRSGLGRLNGHAAIDDFIEYKHSALKPDLAGTLDSAGALRRQSETAPRWGVPIGGVAILSIIFTARLK